jgi:hypothetical protein
MSGETAAAFCLYSDNWPIAQPQHQTRIGSPTFETGDGLAYLLLGFVRGAVH